MSPTSKAQSSQSCRAKRYQNRQLKEAHPDGPCDQSEVEDNDSEDGIRAAQGLVKLLNSKQDVMEIDINTATNSLVKVHDAEVQVDTQKISTLSDLLKTDSSLRSFTGINNFQILECVVEMTKRVQQDARSHRLNVKERIILTITKLKLDLSYVTLGALFNISGQLCKTYFFDTLTVLSSVLKSCIYFPSAEEISKNLPKCFRKFQNCIVVLDCTEIIVQTPKCLCCRIKFYSQYKKK